MRGKTYAGRKPRRLRTHGRSWGTGASLEQVAAKRAERREASAERAASVLAEVLELFKGDELPARVAETYIARLEGTAPSASWSLGNQLVMLLNGTTDARGYRQWQSAGRHVVKGARAFHILGPAMRKITETDAETGVETVRPVVCGFVAIPVFKVEDTDGAPVTVPDYTPPELPPLHDVAERLGVRVDYGPFVDRFRGYYAPGEGRIMLVTHDAVTFFHELSHVAHDRVLRARGESLKRGQDAGQEIVAELTAAVLCRLYGLDGYLASCKEYVDHYGGANPGRVIMRVLNDVQACLLLLLEDTLGVTFAETETAAA